MRYEKIKVRTIEDPKRFLYAISDIHGCVVELKELIEQLDVTKDDLIVFCGDYIDRGPNSKDVIDYLIKLKKKFPQTVFLRGNHDSMMMDFIRLPGNYYGDSHLMPQNGGESFWFSYNMTPTFARNARIEGESILPSKHIDFFRNTEYSVETSKFIFVHAGFHPRNGLDNQLEEDAIWIREEWIRCQHTYGKTVICGHSRVKDIAYDLPFKILIDTGCAYGGKLSCIELNNMKEYHVEAKVKPCQHLKSP